MFLPFWANAQAKITPSPTITLPWNTYTATYLPHVNATADVRRTRFMELVGANALFRFINLRTFALEMLLQVRCVSGSPEHPLQE